MAIDTAVRRASSINVGLLWRGLLPFPDGTIATEDRYLVGGVYSGLIATVPTQLDQIGNLSASSNSGTHAFDLSVYFSGATSYSIAPAIEAGWSFSTSTAVLTIDTDANGTFGPYTVTATNAAGSTPSNTFTVKVGPSKVCAYRDFGFNFRSGF